MLNHTQEPTKTNPPNHSVSDTENQLIELSDIIGSISGSNASFTLSLARFVNKLGKPVEEMTLAELAAIVEQCNKAFNAGTEPQIEQVSVSPTKHKSLKKQHEIIGHALSIFEIDANQVNKAQAKTDTLELARMLDDLPKVQRKTSCFNVLDKSRQLIAERVTFDQAKQYPDAIVKFAGMQVAQ